VFFLQNNQWAISEPSERQTRIPLYQRSRGFGFPGVRVDGNDVLAVHAVTKAALDRARAGEGPTLVEAFTYRMGAHTTSDDPSRYRLSAEVEHWKLRDPIARVKVYLARSGWAGEEYFAAVEAEAESLALEVRRVTREFPEPDPVRMFDHVYSGDHPLVDQERAWFEQYTAQFEPPVEVTDR
jgi:2-oxoisovalerate dehydrogenase E1 component alpha subunit